MTPTYQQPLHAQHRAGSARREREPHATRIGAAARTAGIRTPKLLSPLGAPKESEGCEHHTHNRTTRESFSRWPKWRWAPKSTLT